MCSKQNLEMAMLSLNGFILMIAIFLLVVGGILIDNEHIHEVYGLRFIDVGAGMTTLGTVFLPVGVLGLYARQTHNKALLSVYCLVVAGMMVVMFSLSLAVALTGQFDYSKSYQEDCLRTDPVYNDRETCNVFLNDHKRAGLRLLWSSYFRNAIIDDSYMQDLIDLQRQGACCGFGPPNRCEEDTRPPPEEYLSHGEVQRRECGVQKWWYPAQLDKAVECDQIVSLSVVDPVNGGCQFDMAVGDCMDRGITQFSRGCAYQLQAWYASLVSPIGYAGVALTFIPVMAVLSSCCLCFKRKDSDVLPRHEDYVPEPMKFERVKVNKMELYSNKEAMVEQLKEKAKDKELKRLEKKMGLS